MPASFLDRLRSGEMLVADGATGTNLQVRGLEPGVPAESWVLERPHEIVRLHRDFIEAGAQIILTCSFGATALRLESVGLKGRAAEINQRAVELARQAIAGYRGGEVRTAELFVGGSIGPCGQLLQPYGTLQPAQAEAAFSAQAQVLCQAGVDLLVIETMFDLGEAAAAVRAAQNVAAGRLPVVCCFSFDRGKRTMMGLNSAQAAAGLAELGVDMIGINCGRSLEENLKALGEMRQATTLPLWFKPNAGLPRTVENGQPLYDITPEMMGGQVQSWLSAGACVVGGCCGTSPAHLRAIASAAHGLA